jgi:quercetin dioxygenase-like cupin family protein
MAYRENGHTARTLWKSPELRIVLIVMKGGSQIAEHRAAQSATVFVHSGEITLRLAEHSVTLEPGQLLVLPPGAPHNVEAIKDATFLLTLPGRA